MNGTIPYNDALQEDGEQREQIEDMEVTETYRYLGTEQHRNTDHAKMKSELRENF